MNEEVARRGEENSRIALSGRFIFLFLIVWLALVIFIVLLSLIMQSNQGVRVVFEGIISRHIIRKLLNKTTDILKEEMHHCSVILAQN